MQANRIIPLLITIFFFAFSRVTAQCFPINGNIDIYDLDSQPNSVLTLTGSTEGAVNTFAIPEGTVDGLQFPAPDIIYEMVIEVGDTFNIFIDLCPSTNFDASIGIIHREDITDCANATDEDIVGFGDYEFFGEWRDSNGLCPDSDYGEIAPGNDGFVPLARDVYLEPGTYYIVVDGDNDGAVGDFTMVIGEMLEFDDYSLQEQNQYVDITFTSPVYGVSNDATWDLGWPMDNNDYFEFTEEDGQPIQTGTVTQVNGQPLENNPYPGYTELRFPLINPPADGSTIFLAPKEYDFNGAIAPHPVNLSGVSFTHGEEMEIELNDLLPPYVAEYSFSEESSSGVHPDTDIIIEFDNPVRFQDGSAFTPVTIATLCLLYYVNELGIPEGEPIPFDATGDIGGATEINSIIITPTDSLIEQSQVLVIIAGNVIVDTSGNIMSEEKNTTFTVADVTPPKITSYSLAPNNKYVLLTFSEDIWSETGQSGSINTTDFVITLNSDDENSNTSEATIEEVADTLDNTVDIYGIDAVRLFLEFYPTPSGAESITISPDSNAIFDHVNIPLSTSSIQFDLFDQLPPSINIKSNNSSDDTGFIHPNASFVVTSTDPLQRTDASPITDDNIRDYITLQYLSNLVEIDFEAEVNQTKTEIKIIPDSILTEWQEVYLIINSQNDDGVSLTDSVDNSIDTTGAIIRVDDVTAPTIDNATIDETNTYITLTTSESVYNGYDETGGVGGLSESHFELLIVPNELNNVQNVAIENVTDPDGAPLQGEETTIRIEIILSRADASGSEIITVSPSERPIYDRAGNEVSVFLNQKTVTLYDMLSPTVSFSPPPDTLIFPNTDFILTFSETIKKYDSESDVIDDLDTSDISSMITLRYINGDVIDYETSFNADTSILTLNPSQILTEAESIELSFGEVFSDEFANSVSPGLTQYTVDDIFPPSFQSYSLGSGNQYVQINMSEGVYTDSSGTGALIADDLNLWRDYGNQNGAQLISIDYLSDINGGALSGGEDAILVNLDIIGSTNGTEKLMVHAVSGEIFDGSGNSMSPNESTNEFNLWAAPVFNENSILNDDNSYVTLFFDNGPVFTNASNSLSIITQDFMVQLTNSDGVISEIMPLYLLIVDENDIPIILPAAGADIVRLGIYLDFIPDGSESIIISPESSSAIYNDEGVNMDGSEFIGSFTLNDQLHPFYSLSIQDGALNIENNDTIIVSFNEPVRISGGQPLTDEIAKENFVILDTTDNDTLENYSTIVNAPSPDSVWVIMNQPFGSEHVISLTVENNFEDFSGNQVLNGSTIFFTVRDNVSPGFVPGSAVIDVEEIEDARGTSEGRRSVCYIDLSINDDVFTDSIASLPVQASDFSVGIIQNGGSVSSGNVENIELSETDIIGKDFLRFKIKFDTVPFGSESLFVHAADNAVFDNGFNPMSPDSTSDTLSLYDLRFPTIDSTSIEHDSYVDLYSDSTILVYFSEPIKPDSFEYSFLSKLDTISFVHDTSLTPDLLTIFLNTPVMSYDTLDLSIIHLEDTSGNIRESLIERRFFTKAVADFSVPPNDTINVKDLDIFLDGWDSGDLTKELGPTSGTAPNFKINADGVFGIDDGMAFTQMWLWSLQKFGPSLVVQEQLVNLPSSILYSDNTISIMPPDSALSGQVMINYDVTDYQIYSGENNELKNNGILLGNNNDQKGISFIEYALHKNNRSAVSFDINNKDQTSSEIKVSYSFFDKDFRLISKGDSILHSIALPTEFTLMQNYPNPFNPSTTIRFAIPNNSFVRLIVYDITGKLVNEIVNGYLEPGVHNVEWSGTDAGGIDVSSGLYFYRIEASNYSKTYKMVFVK